MPSEMRRPGQINLDSYIVALDRQLREATRRPRRGHLPTAFHRVVRAVKTALQPILLSGAMVMTSLAVILAVGVAPASIRTPQPTDTVLARPSAPEVVVPVDTEPTTILDNLPADELLAMQNGYPAVQKADNPDTPPMEME